MGFTEKEKSGWARWLDNFGPRPFLNHFLRNVEGAESICAHCNHTIYVDVMIGGGVADWSTFDGNFGCQSVRSNGSHMPRRRA